MALKRRAGVILLIAGLLYFLLPPLSSAATRQGTLEFLLGEYTINEPLFELIYNKTGGRIQGLVLSASLFFNLNFYLELKAFHKVGELSYSKEKTTLVLAPISLGLRYILPLKYVQPYAGAGVDYCLFYETNPIGSIFNYVKGFHYLGGVYLTAGENFPLLLNLRVKYTDAPTEVNKRKLQLGGVEYAAAIVIAF